MYNIRGGYIKANLEQYKVFLEAAVEGSFSKAAKKLYISQSAVSQSIGNLEECLGARLFIRLPRGANLTNEGKILLDHIKPAFSLITSAEKKLEEIEGLKSGTVSVSASDTFCMYFLPPLIDRFKGRHPGIGLNIANKTTHETIAMLQSGECDIGIVNLLTEEVQELHIWKKKELNNCFIIQKGSLEDPKKKYSPAGLCNLPLMLLEKGTSTRQHIDKYFLESGVETKPVIELGSVELLIRFAANGLGVSCVAMEFLEKSGYRDKVDIVLLEKPIKKRHMGVVTLKDIPVSRPAKAFLDAVMEEL